MTRCGAMATGNSGLQLRIASRHEVDFTFAFYVFLVPLPSFNSVALSNI
jgi:hypothetical protein